MADWDKAAELDGDKLERLHKTMRDVLENLQHMNEAVFGVYFPTDTEADRLKRVETELTDMQRVYLGLSQRVGNVTQNFHALERELRGPMYEPPGERVAKLEKRVAALEETVRKLGGKA